MGQCFACLDDGKKQQRHEQELSASADARARAAEAAQRSCDFCEFVIGWQEQFEKSAAGRAARAQQVAMAKHATNNDRAPGQPVLKWQMG